LSIDSAEFELCYFIGTLQIVNSNIDTLSHFAKLQYICTGGQTVAYNGGSYSVIITGDICVSIEDLVSDE